MDSCDSKLYFSLFYHLLFNKSILVYFSALFIILCAHFKDHSHQCSLVLPVAFKTFNTVACLQVLVLRVNTSDVFVFLLHLLPMNNFQPVYNREWRLGVIKINTLL